MREPEDILPFRLRGKPVRRDHSFPAAYQLTHVRTGDVYVGSTHDLYLRINQHYTRLAAGEHKNHRLQQVYDLCPEFRIIYCAAIDVEDALDMEQELLDGYACHDNVLNIARNARSAGLGVVRSEVTKSRNREANRRQFASEDARRAHSEITRRKFEDPEYRARHIERATETRGVPITFRGVRYRSLAEAARAHGITGPAVRYHLNKQATQE